MDYRVGSIIKVRAAALGLGATESAERRIDEIWKSGTIVTDDRLEGTPFGTISTVIRAEDIEAVIKF
ncbi:MAG: hypothetical protein OCU12_07135 [Methanophagales archaeon]|nr:hypothetical protein [Methanophagales archaeon]